MAVQKHVFSLITQNNSKCIDFKRHKCIEVEYKVACSEYFDTRHMSVSITVLEIQHIGTSPEGRRGRIPTAGAASRLLGPHPKSRGHILSPGAASRVPWVASRVPGPRPEFQGPRPDSHGLRPKSHELHPESHGPCPESRGRVPSPWAASRVTCAASRIPWAAPRVPWTASRVLEPRDKSISRFPSSASWGCVPSPWATSRLPWLIA